MKYIELKHGSSLEELLHDMYIEKGLSIREIAQRLGVHYHTINSWLKLAKIDMRLPHEKLLELIDIKERLKESSNE